MQETPPDRPLRRGWTTGACAAAATRAAAEGLWTGAFPPRVRITLPGGQQPEFAIATEARGHDASGPFARAGVVKDAGDDPDITHGALIIVEVRTAPLGSGVIYRAGDGVGMVTRPGLPIPPGEPAINPVPRRLIAEAVAAAAIVARTSPDAIVTVGVENGAALAQKTLNPRLGILGGLSILGTTGIVVPYSCAAWIDTIHRGIDVARALALPHVAGATGSTSEAAVARLHGLPETALIDMGDFVGGMLKYLRQHPVPRVTIAGGFAKMTKLAQGRLDLHSKRGHVDLDQLAVWLADAGAAPDLVAATRQANTALEVLERAHAAGIPLATIIAAKAAEVARAALGQTSIALDVAVFDRQGELLSVSGD